MPKLRHFQQQVNSESYAAWDAGAQNVCAVAPTGSGKTVMAAALILERNEPTAAIAHRQELVSQISIALARNGVRHRIFGARPALMRIIAMLHRRELGQSFIHASSRVGVGGIDTVIRHPEPWFNSVRFLVIDESHHILKENKWGKGVELFPNAQGWFPTATPCRADGKGLGRNAAGLADVMVQAPGMRELIRQGYLTDYRYYGIPCSSLDIANIKRSAATGDYTQGSVKNAVRESKIVGDVVAQYSRIALGKLGVTFVPDVETGADVSAAFNAAGIRAQLVTANTPADTRAQWINEFRDRKIMQLVNVDLFGEGFDLPAIECVSFARPTLSFALYSQQWGRALRLMVDPVYSSNWDAYSVSERRTIIANSGKPRGIIIDHVNNLMGFNGPPDRVIQWSLDGDGRNARKTDGIPSRVCPECANFYEAYHKVCPFCGYKIEPADRSKPEFVDGDLTELDPSILEIMRGEKTRIDGDFHAPAGLGDAAQYAARANWDTRRAKQLTLRNAISWYAGVCASIGMDESETYRRFFFEFGTDIMSAQTLGSREAEELTGRIDSYMKTLGVDIAVDAEAYFSK